ncbi:hypothetical protein DX116_13495 [Aeromicrobium endophyticum]|uniref:Uncharacterized protein n=2 Tax=Aeromicrobium endophyticum TaxID=2292704 RepID=A0A371P2K5_9ACTN|nr:hypothetical protein DX116_13495 [Aeromicrobium endophyticum]
MDMVPTAELVGYLDNQMSYLRNTNDLSTSVGNHGILSELLLVPLVFNSGYADPDDVDLLKDLEIAHDDGSRTVLTSVDGNSRLAGAYRHLRLDPSDVLTKLVNSPRTLRQRIGTYLAFADNPEMTLEEAAALRSLTAPAAIVVGFRADTPHINLVEAVQSRLGAIHVSPASPWSTSSQLDMLLNATLDARQSDFESWSNVNEGAFTAGQYRDWLAGNLDADQATEAGLDPHPDVRAASLRWWLRDHDLQVAKAIRRLDVVRSMDASVRTNIAAEGALRSFRSELRTDSEADNVRRVLVALWQIDDLKGDWEVDDDEGLGSLKKLMTDATGEVALLGRPGDRGRLLMVVAFYWMARARLVPLQTRGGMKDRRKVGDVVTLMCRTEHGMRQLARIVHDSRAERTPVRVNPKGQPILGPDGRELLFTDEWMRDTWSSGYSKSPVVPLSAEKDLENREAVLVGAIEKVVHELASLREPQAGDGTPLVDTSGIQVANADRALAQLKEIAETVTEYRFLARRANPAADAE